MRRKLKRLVTFLNNIHGPLLAFFTLALVGVGGLQWCTLEKTDKTLRAAQRAWIHPYSVTLANSLAPETTGYRLDYENVGREPAINVVIATPRPRIVNPSDKAFSSGWVGGDNGACKDAQPNKNGLVIWPSSVRSAGGEMSYGSPDRLPEDFRDGNEILIIEGCIGYDTNGEAHYSGYCFYTTRFPRQSGGFEWSTVPCMNHNFAR